MNNGNRRGGRRNRRPPRRAPGILAQELRGIQHAVQSLTTLTQDRSMPSRRDVQPLSTSARPIPVTFRRTYTVGYLTASNVVNAGAIAFTLDSVPNYTEFTSLFDQYRILQAEVKFIPLTLEFGPSTNSSVAFPSVYTVIDLDDNITPTSVAELQQYDTCQVVPNQTYFSRIVNPRFAVASYSGTFTSYAQSIPFQWIDVASPSVQYYGVKWACSFAGDLSNPATYKLFNIEVTLTFQCRNSR